LTENADVSKKAADFTKKKIYFWKLHIKGYFHAKIASFGKHDGVFQDGNVTS